MRFCGQYIPEIFQGVTQANDLFSFNLQIIKLMTYVRTGFRLNYSDQFGKQVWTSYSSELDLNNHLYI